MLPFFVKHLADEEGNGVDLGCGDGDLTEHIGSKVAAHIFGIDSDSALIDRARERKKGNLDFIEGDLSKNRIPHIGINFDFAYSNCCLTHLSDEGVYGALIDLQSCMSVGGKFAFVVPHIEWAKKMYCEVQYCAIGITAIPRFGDRQAFRYPQWYATALEKCGFEEIDCQEIKIPDDSRLEARYLDEAGTPLFSTFTAIKSKTIPNLDSLKKAFEVAHDNRKLEISLFWQRSLFFWGFVATALIGYGTTYTKAPDLSFFFAVFGLVCSIVWASGNRGSKYWQEYWEKKVNFYQNYVVGNVFFDRSPERPGFFSNYAGRRISVSKLTMALSDFVAMLWALLCFYSVIKPLYHLDKRHVWVIFLLIVLLTLAYCLVFLRNSDSED